MEVGCREDEVPYLLAGHYARYGETSACDAGLGVWLDDAFFFSTARKSRKGQNLAANPACTVTNDDGEEAVIVEGDAAVLSDATELQRVAAAYKKKYKMDPRSMGEPIFRVRPVKVFGLVEKTFPKSATRWKLPRSSASN